MIFKNHSNYFGPVVALHKKFNNEIKSTHRFVDFRVQIIPKLNNFIGYTDNSNKNEIDKSIVNKVSIRNKYIL